MDGAQLVRQTVDAQRAANRYRMGLGMSTRDIVSATSKGWSPKGVAAASKVFGFEFGTLHRSPSTQLCDANQKRRRSLLPPRGGLRPRAGRVHDPKGGGGWGFAIAGDGGDGLHFEADKNLVQFSGYTVRIGGFDYPLNPIVDDDEAGPDFECACDTDTVSVDADVRDEKFFSLDSSCGTMDKDLIFAAWSVLVDNLDLVADAAAEYEPTMLATLQNEVLGREFFILYFGDRITVKCADLGSGTSADYLGSEERIRLDDDYLMMLRFLWDEADAAGGRTQRKGQACVAADLAATILHELVHADGYGFDPSDAGHSTFLIENYFRYYVMKRLCVLGWGCCNWQTSTEGNYEILVGNSRFNSEFQGIGSSRNVCNDEGSAC